MWHETSGPLILIKNGCSAPLAVGPYLKLECKIKGRFGPSDRNRSLFKGERVMPLALSCNNSHSLWGHWYAHYLRNDVPKVKVRMYVCACTCPLLGTQTLLCSIILFTADSDTHQHHSPSEHWWSAALSHEPLTSTMFDFDQAPFLHFPPQQSLQIKIIHW